MTNEQVKKAIEIVRTGRHEVTWNIDTAELPEVDKTKIKAGDTVWFEYKVMEDDNHIIYFKNKNIRLIDSIVAHFPAPVPPKAEIDKPKEIVIPKKFSSEIVAFEGSGLQDIKLKINYLIDTLSEIVERLEVK